MKTMKSIIVATLLVAATTLMAQTTCTNAYADQAFEQTSELVSSLNLSNQQTMDILAINQKYANLEANNATNTQLSKREARKAKKGLAAAKADEIKSVLKDKQLDKYEHMIATHKAAPQLTPSVAFNSAVQTIYFDVETPSISRSMR